MNCTHKEYEVKNATVPMTTAKNEVVIGLLHENYCLVRGIGLWWGGNEKLVGRNLLRGFF